MVELKPLYSVERLFFCVFLDHAVHGGSFRKNIEKIFWV